MPGISASLSAVGKLSEFLTGQVGMTHRFVVAIDQGEYDLGTWSRVSGLSVSWAKYTYRPGSSNDETLVPGNATYPNITLSRAACHDSGTVQQWLAATTKERTLHSGAIYMIDFLGQPVVTWELKTFFPIGWKITEFDAGGAKPAIESLDLAHNGFLHDEVMPG